MLTLTLTFTAFSILGFILGYHAGRWAEKTEVIETLGTLAEEEWRNGYEAGRRAQSTFVRRDDTDCTKIWNN